MVINTQQHARHETDINLIMKRYKKGAQLPNQELIGSLRYGDVSEVPDFLTIRNQMIKAEEAFLSLPGKLRREFGDDPVEFLQFMANPENRARAEELGIMKKKVDPSPDYQKMMVEELQKLNKSKEGAQSST